MPNDLSNPFFACSGCGGVNQIPLQQNPAQALAAPRASVAGSQNPPLNARERPLQGNAQEVAPGVWRDAQGAITVVLSPKPPIKPPVNSECSSCLTPLGMFSKYPCTACGHTFCAKCRSGRAPLPHLGYTTPQYVCHPCRKKYVSPPPPFEEKPKCGVCRTGFGIFNLGRHHCRCCGKSVCQQCSRSTMLLPGLGFPEPVRVCTNCAIDQHNYQTALLAAIAAAKARAPVEPSMSPWSALSSLAQGFFGLFSSRDSNPKTETTTGETARTGQAEGKRQPWEGESKDDEKDEHKDFQAQARDALPVPVFQDNRVPEEFLPSAPSLEASAPYAEPVPEDKACVVCLEAPADHAVLMCMHVCLCENCARLDLKSCPKCRSDVAAVKKIFL